MKKLLCRFRATGFPGAVYALALTLAAVAGLKHGADAAVMAVLFAWGVLWLYDAPLPQGESRRMEKFRKAGAWLLTATAIPAGPVALPALGFWCVLTAVILHESDFRRMLYFAAGTAAAIFLLPFAQEWTLILSYPLRILSSSLSTELLKLCTLDVDCTGAMMRIGHARIAITDQCSGIDQLPVLMLLGYVIVRTDQCACGWKILHFLLILPAVLLANTLRLTVTSALYFLWGDRIFTGTVHSLLGILLVLLTVWMIWAVRGLFPVNTKEVPSE